MIIPSRWFAGGRGLDNFRNKMMHDRHIKLLYDYIDSKECFAGVDVSGGITYFLRDSIFNGACKFYNIKNNQVCYRKRFLDEFNIIVRDNYAIDIIHKICKSNAISMDKTISVQNPFGFISSYRGKELHFENAIKLKTSSRDYYVKYEEIKKNKEIVPKYKVIFGKATCEHGGIPDKTGKYKIFTSLEILPKNEICTQSYFVAASFDNYDSAKNCLNYLKTKFVRFLVLQALTSQDLSKDKFIFVPLLDFSTSWTDTELYAKYNLTQDEIDYIESMIKPMDLPSDTDSEPQNA